jgi:hypothetical protein
LRIVVLIILVWLVAACGPSAPVVEESPTPESPPAETPLVETPVEEGTPEAYPPPVAAVPETPRDYPAPELPPVPVTTAEEAYPLAQAEAGRWNPDAEFMGIVPGQQMAQNLQIPPLAGGWFFKFAVPGELDEYYILVLGDSIAGTTEAQPILIEPLPYTEEVIDLDELQVSSEAFQQRFLESEAGARFRENFRPYAVDYRLVDLDSTPNPVWSALDPQTGDELFHMDAVTGEVVESPFLAFQ